MVVCVPPSSIAAGESAYYEAELGAEVVKFGRKYIIPKVRGQALQMLCLSSVGLHPNHVTVTWVRTARRLHVHSLLSQLHMCFRLAPEAGRWLSRVGDSTTA